MKNRIQINLGTDHTLECADTIIGRSGEGLVSRLEITVPEALNGYNVYIDFEKPNGESLRTPKLEVEYGVAYYDVPQYLLIENGDIKVQLVFENSNGRVWKSSKKRYTILKSINAVDDIPEKEDFISEAQKLIDELNQEVTDIAEVLANNADFAQAVINACGGQTQIITINGKVLRFFVDTQEEYDKLSEAQQQNLFAIITDDTTRDAILNSIEQQRLDLSATEGRLTNKITMLDAVACKGCGLFPYSIGQLMTVASAEPLPFGTLLTGVCMKCGLEAEETGTSASYNLNEADGSIVVELEGTWQVLGQCSPEYYLIHRIA